MKATITIISALLIVLLLTAIPIILANEYKPTSKINIILSG